MSRGGSGADVDPGTEREPAAARAGAAPMRSMDPIGRKRSRRRGAALVLVLIFSVASLMMITTLLALTDKNAKTMGEVERHKNLQAVLKTGIAAAVNEINRKEFSGAYDPGSDGVGALTGWDGSTDPTTTPPPGVAVNVTVNGKPRTLGFYRTTVRKVSGKDFLTVIAAWPSFSAPPEQLLLAAAELELETTFTTVTTAGGDGPVNPVNIAGKGGELDIQIKHDETTLITSGIDLAASSNVPAANIEADSLVSDFISDFADKADTFVGVDEADPEDTTTDPSATITSSEPRAMSLEKLHDAYTYFSDRGAALMGTGTDVGDKVGGAVDYFSGADKVYYADKSLTIEKDGVLRGEGTLIVQDQFHIKGTLDWTGDVIIIGDSGQLHVQPGKTLTGTQLTVTGNLVMATEKQNQFHIQNSSSARIDGAMLMLTDSSGSQNQIHIQNDTSVQITGIMAVLSNDIQFKVQNSSSTAVNSLNFALDNESELDKNKLQMQVQNDAVLDLTHHSVETAEALAGLQLAIGSVDDDETTITTKVVKTKSYWEPGVEAVRTLQASQFTLNKTGPWGY